jgi:hypothetical protein
MKSKSMSKAKKLLTLKNSPIYNKSKELNIDCLYKVNSLKNKNKINNLKRFSLISIKSKYHFFYQIICLISMKAPIKLAKHILS